MASTVKVGIIGGSGLDDPDILKNRREKAVTTPFGPPSDALILGEIEGVSCVLLARHGRKHSVMPGKINYRANIWALKEEGCTHVLASNACGSLQEDIPPGMLVIIDNFIDRTTNRIQTFYDGEPESPLGLCHMPMEPAFCPRTRQALLETSSMLGLGAKDGGTIVVIEGPRFSSKAESKMYQQFGAHMVGMTTVPEVVLAREAGLCYAVVALSTDYDCWRESGEKVSHKFVLENFKKNVNKVIQLITSTIPHLASQDWTDTLQEMKDLVEHSVMLPHDAQQKESSPKTCAANRQNAK